MTIEKQWNQTLGKSQHSSNQTNLGIPGIDLCFSKFLHFWKIFSSNHYVTGFVTGSLTVLVIAIFCYIFFCFKRKIAKKYSVKSPNHHTPESSLKSWNSEEKGQTILKWDYPEEKELLESDSIDSQDSPNETKGHHILDVRHKGTIRAPRIVKNNQNKPEPIQEVVLQANMPQMSSTSVASRKLTGEEWRKAFSKEALNDITVQ